MSSGNYIPLTTGKYVVGDVGEIAQRLIIRFSVSGFWQATHLPLA